MSGCEEVDVSKPELVLQVTETVLIEVPVSVEVLCTVHSPLYDRPTSPVYTLIAKHLNGIENMLLNMLSINVGSKFGKV